MSQKSPTVVVEVTSFVGKPVCIKYIYMIGINHVLNHLSPPDFAPIHLGAIYINIYFNPSRTDIYRYIYI